MALKTRSEIDAAFKWRLSDIYPDRSAWENALKATASAIDSLDELPGTLTVSIESLKNGLDRIYQTMEPLYRLCAYAELTKSGDNSDPEAQELSSRASRLAARFSTAVSFLDPEILSIPADTLHSWMENPILADYRHILHDTARGRAHTLPAEQEKLLSQLSDAAQTPDDVFTMLNSADITFPDVEDGEGKLHPLSHGTYGSYLRSTDRVLRQNAFEAYHGAFRQFINTIGAMYIGAIRLDDYFATVRGYDSPLHHSLFASNVPVAVYDALTEAVHNGLPVMQRYLKLRKRVLGIEALHMYDLYTPMVSSVDMPLELEECKALVKRALAPLGEEYAGLLRLADEQQWMDIYENKGKTTGAFSYGVHGVHPFVLLNFNGTLNDAFTMAHELGHAMHSWFSSRENSFPNHSYKLMVAEVASTVNEVLLTKYLLSVETEPAKRAFLLNNLLESFRTTVFRQTLFAEFERKAHEAYSAGEALTADGLSQLYRELNELYYSECEVDELQSVEWARIPHFYSAYYVYQYATGFCSAVAIADRIYETGDASDYLRFLTTGGSDYPMEELKIAGVDLSGPEVVTRALGVFEETLAELEALLDTLD